jgi:hypothetical protein
MGSWRSVGAAPTLLLLLRLGRTAAEGVRRTVAIELLRVKVPPSVLAAALPVPMAGVAVAVGAAAAPGPTGGNSIMELAERSEPDVAASVVDDGRPLLAVPNARSPALSADTVRCRDMRPSANSPPAPISIKGGV